MKTKVFVFTVAFIALFSVNSTTSIETLQTGLYDPWLDLNDDGEIDIFDVVMVARAYGSSGEPFNKTAALLELQAKVSILEATIAARLPPVDFLCIPAAAFTSEDQPVNGDRVNWGYMLESINQVAATFYAPVQLPSGVTITRLTSYWFDEGPDQITCELIKDLYSSGPEILATVNSPQAAGPGNGVTSNFTISQPTINNVWQYYIKVRIPPPYDQPFPEPSLKYRFHYALILYEYST